MKLLIIGSDEVYAIENMYVRYLRELGIEVFSFSSRRLFYDYYKMSLVHKLLFKAGLSPIYHSINSELKNLIERIRPNIIWVFKGMEIFPDTLKYAREMGVKLANYNPDNPFLFSGNGSGNSNVSESIGLYDLHFTYNLQVLEQIKKNHNVRVSFLPFGYDLSYQLYESLLDQSEIIEACFLGNPDSERVKFIKGLAERGIKIALYGNDWQRYVHHGNVKIFPPVYAEKLWSVLRQYRVQLNVMRIHNVDSHNMRTFEVPGVGGIMLAPDTKEHHLFFENQKEIFLYKDIDDCVKQITFLLSISTEKSNEIRKSARDRSEQSGYNYKHRAAEVYVELNKLLLG